MYSAHKKYCLITSIIVGFRLKTLASSSICCAQFEGNVESVEAVPVAHHLNAFVAFNRKREIYTNSFLASMWRVYITNLYLFCKLLNLVNIFVQFALLNQFLGPQYTFWGFGILNDIIKGRQWAESGHFPRVTLCDVNIREIGNVNRKTVQCVLMINMLNEKIFIGIWFWLLFVGVLTFVNLLYWIVISYHPNLGKDFIGRKLAFKSIRYTEPELKEFYNDAICKDGVTVLRLIGENAGELIAAEAVAGLWRIYKEETKNPDDASQCTEEDVTDISAEQAPPLPEKQLL
ncbi:hypothetical protein AB6A40_002824 [Gnathostoma spinigerum]|uniref:Innexin n=1 Tax=Gnathostoma spinigerum TaxID=75299 RepID=A0ABD6E7P6_9BILA